MAKKRPKNFLKTSKNGAETLANRWPPICPEFRHPKNYQKHSKKGKVRLWFQNDTNNQRNKIFFCSILASKRHQQPTKQYLVLFNFGFKPIPKTNEIRSDLFNFGVKTTPKTNETRSCVVQFWLQTDTKNQRNKILASYQYLTSISAVSHQYLSSISPVSHQYLTSI